MKDEGYWQHRGYDITSVQKVLREHGEEELEKRLREIERIREALNSRSFLIYASLHTDIYRKIEGLKILLKRPDKLEEAVVEFKALNEQVKHLEAKDRLSAQIKKLESAQRTKGGRVEEIFLIYKDGRLIAHYTPTHIDKADPDIIAGMITALQEFIKHCLKTGEPLRSIGYGSMTLFIVSGENVYLAAMVSGRVADIEERMRRALTLIERRYKQYLTYWDGDLTPFAGAESILRRI